jgi:hypothetical protein
VVNVVTRTGNGVDGTELAASYQSPQVAREGRATWGKLMDNGLDVLMSASGYNAQGQNLYMNYPGGGPGGTNISGVASGMDGESDQRVFTHLSRGPMSFDFSYGNRRKDDPTGAYLSDPLIPDQYQRDRFLLTQLKYQDRLADDTLQRSGRLYLDQERYTGLEYYAGTPQISTASSD